jgi:hypothetical protein
MGTFMDPFLSEFLKADKPLRLYLVGINAIMHTTGGQAEATGPEAVVSDLYYYWSAALVNAGDVFSYLPFIIEHKQDFAAIGAHGTLKALEALMPFYTEQQELEDINEQHAYAGRMRDQLDAAQEAAEDVQDFARLLLAYARENLPEPRTQDDR